MPISTGTLLALQGLGMAAKAGGAGYSAYAAGKDAAKDRLRKSKEFQQTFEENQRQFDESLDFQKLKQRTTGQATALQMLAALGKMGGKYGHLGLLSGIGA